MAFKFMSFNFYNTPNRLFYSSHFDKSMKVGASVVCARRGGCSSTFDELNKFFTISGMPVASSQYWNSIHGGVGGHADCMAHLGAGLDASGKKITKALCGGTMAATPISCVAGYYALCEIEKRNACEVAGRMGDRLTKGLQELIKKYNLPFVAFNTGSVCHLDSVGTMHFAINWSKPWTI